MLCRCAALADALPPCRWLEFSSDGCFAVVVGWSGGCFAILLGLRIFAPLAVQFLLAGSVVWVWLGSRVRESLFYVLMVFFSLVCTFFSISLLLVLSAHVG